MSREDVEEMAERAGIRSIMHLNPEVVVKHLVCPRCGSPGAEIVRGKSVIVEAVELDVGDGDGG
jgi:Zn finger protein HypA/HybF involved in hydrogenase expression